MANAPLKSLGGLFRESSQAVRRNLSLFIFLNTLTILGAAWDIGLDIRDKKSGGSWSDVFTHTFTGGGASYPDLNGLLVTLLVLIGVILYLMALILSVRAANHTRVNLADVWEIFAAKWWKIIAIEFLVILLICVGLVLLIIPGLIILSRLALAPIIMIDRDVGIIEALNISWDMTKGYAWIVFITILFGLLLSIPSIIPVIGKLIATVLTIAYSVALPIRYFELKRIEK